MSLRFPVCLLACALRAGTAGESVQVRVTEDVKRGEPIVVHVVVALCDNLHQGIVPVPKAIGNGQDPRSNLYWGAGFGVRTFLVRKGGWALVKTDTPGQGILERIVLRKQVRRAGQATPVLLVAEAWDGKEIRNATARFLALAAGHQAEALTVPGAGPLKAGGASHLVAYVGHDGLMDFPAPWQGGPANGAPPRSAMVLACASRAFFLAHLTQGGSHPLLLTTNLMAPEAYTLDAAVTAWVRGGTTAQVCEAAGTAYAAYQKISPRAGRRLFTGEP